jgi:hypothetical protein
MAARLSRWQPTLRRSGLRARWGVSDGRALSSWGASIRFVDEWCYDRHAERWRWRYRLRRLPAVRGLMRIVHIEFA